MDPARRLVRTYPALQPERSPAAEYIVVGSGAGGGTVAARLAEAGHTVLVLEAGGDPRQGPGADDYDVPGFHPLATDNEAMKWDFFVRHYQDAAQQERDPNYLKEWNNQPVDGVWYPRAGTLGGCTAHNALILVYPHQSDWDQLADLTGDPSWRADAMRAYFQRLENCKYRPFERLRSRFGMNPSRHGWDGWLHTETAVPSAAIRSRDLKQVIFESVKAALEETGAATGARFDSRADPNDWRVVRDSEDGIRYTPLTTRNHQRIGTRERLLEVRDRYPDRLKIEMNALATRIIFDDRQRAIGVEYQKGERLYRADPRSSATDGERRSVYAAREVILAGGTFNTPQLLMLSGIGPRESLARHGITARVALDGVGRNLQDRYEVAVENRMKFDSWQMLEGATFTNSDPQYKEWAAKRDGVYTTNGAILSVIARSMVDRPVPDLFCYALLATFSGYRPNYSKKLAANPNCLTWVILKGHTNNTGGEVTLRSGNPRDTPAINFRYFEEGTDARGDDLKAVVEGIRLVRKLTAGLKEQGLIAKEESPGDEINSQKDLEQFVRNRAWGHHASGTCAIGARERGGVLSSDFKVHGTEGLRVVDASVFPRIPGLFIASAIFMIGEKAAEVIIADAKRTV